GRAGQCGRSGENVPLGKRHMPWLSGTLKTWPTPPPWSFQVTLLIGDNGTMFCRLSLRTGTDPLPWRASIPTAARVFALLVGLGLLELVAFAALLTSDL